MVRDVIHLSSCSLHTMGHLLLVESCCMDMTRNAIRRYCEMKMMKMDGVETNSRTIQIVSRDEMIELVNDLDSYRR